MDYSNVPNIKAKNVPQNADGSELSTTEPQVYCVLIYAKANIKEWELLMLMDLALWSNYQVACFAYSQENKLFQISSLSVETLITSYTCYVVYNICVFKGDSWMHLTTHDLITTWKYFSILIISFDQIPYILYLTQHRPTVDNHYPIDKHDADITLPLQELREKWGTFLTKIREFLSQRKKS